MFSLEPPRTAYDLHFRIAGIPIRVHPLFWLAALILGTSGNWDAEGNVDPDAGMQLLMWTGVLFVSILVHELGHSFVIRYFGQLPRIVLYMLGGLAITDAESSYRISPCGAAHATAADPDQSGRARCRLRAGLCDRRITAVPGR